MARILVADDEEGIRSYVAEALELDGHHVLQAEDGAVAARLLDRDGFDLVITDLKMPGLDGMDLLRKVRQEQPDVEVVVLTAHGTVDTAVEAMKAGAFDYLQKPVSGPAELRLLAGRALQRRSLLALQSGSQREQDDGGLVWEDPAMEPVVGALKKVARTTATVLLLGDSGTGKEVAARAVHGWSDRHDGPFVAVNCAALSDTLLESELFGHEKGAFTGAHARRRGRLELAQGGTFFLDEIGELRPDLQAKLLRVLQERQFERVGGVRTLHADVRWVAATNRDLAAMMEQGSFREDLYHRLAVFPVRVPPLAERPADVLPLARELLRRVGQELGRPGLCLDEEAAEQLRASAWPGNVRQLRNALERAAILADGPEIRREHLWSDPTLAGAVAAPVTLAALERQAIERTLAACGGNRKAAAQQLGIGERTLYEKLKRFKG